MHISIIHSIIIIIIIHNTIQQSMNKKLQELDELTGAVGK